MTPVTLTLYDRYTNEPFSFIPVTLNATGSPITDADVDDVIYCKGKNGFYYKRSWTGAVNVKWFGAKGDGVTDDTVAFQKAINSAPINSILDGSNYTYLRQNLILKSNITLQNFNFTIPNNVNVANDCSLCIGGISNTTPATALQNITLKNININGNRQNQTTGQDPNWQLTGILIRGYAQNILIEDCTANYCGVDGLQIYSGFLPSNYTLPVFENIKIKNCEFLYNRRHGISMDSADSILFDGVTANNNGLDLNTTDAFTQGTRGARNASTNLLYGNGIDCEGYGNNTQMTNIYFKGCNFLQNWLGGFLFYNTGDPTLANFGFSENIVLDGCHIDGGQNGTDNIAIIFTPPAAQRNTGNMCFKNFRIIGGKLTGSYTASNIDGFSIDGCYIVGFNGYIGSHLYCTDIFIGNIVNPNGLPIYEDTVTKNQYIQYTQAVVSTQRPTNLHIGQTIFDTTISKLIYWNGSVWVDPTAIATTTNVGTVKKSVAIVGTAPTAVTQTSPAAAATYTQADIQKMVDDITHLTQQLNNAIAYNSSLITNLQAAGIQT